MANGKENGTLVAVSGDAMLFCLNGDYVVRVAGKDIATAKAPKGGGGSYPKPPAGGRWRWLFTAGGGEGAKVQAKLEGDKVTSLTAKAKDNKPTPIKTPATIS